MCIDTWFNYFLLEVLLLSGSANITGTSVKQTTHVGATAKLRRTFVFALSSPSSAPAAHPASCPSSSLVLPRHLSHLVAHSALSLILPQYSIVQDHVLYCCVRM